MTGRKLAITGLGVALSLTACSSTHHGAPGGSPTTATTAVAGSATTTPPNSSAATVTTSPIGTAAAGSGSTPAGTGSAGPARCTTSSLGGTLGNANGAAGSVYYTLVLTNHGSVSCVLQGYPGVSFVTGPSGQQVGAAAARIQGSTPAVTLAPGASSGAVLQITDAGNFGSGCRSTPVAGLRVYAPGQLTSLFVTHADQACANPSDVTLHVGAFQPPA